MADATAAAGNDCNSVFEPEIQVFLLRRTSRAVTASPTGRAQREHLREDLTARNMDERYALAHSGHALA
ncbi:MAG TPA: hypothetical protein VK522_02705, partial [Pseudolabrys sp.]|nr:hypothetical protein [Pseudolabrys sp.]